MRELGESEFARGHSEIADQSGIQVKSPLIANQIVKSDLWQLSSLTRDLIIFLGCLLYPKDIEQATKSRNEEYKAGEQESVESTRSMSYKTIHTYLYSFSLEKLNNLINLKYFAFFFCHYFKHGILNGKRIERKLSMRRHMASYTEACNLILSLCQETLKCSIMEGGRASLDLGRYDGKVDDSILELI